MEARRIASSVLAADYRNNRQKSRDNIRQIILNRYRQRRRYFFLLFKLFLLNNLLSLDRTVWVAPRPIGWWEQLRWRETDWIQNLRMSQNTYLQLCHLLAPHLMKKDTHLRKAVSVQKRVAVALWRLGTQVEYRTIAHLFGLGRSTVHAITREFCKAVCQHLQPIFVSFPNANESEQIIDSFLHQWGFPQVVGCLDGTHIQIDRPDGPNATAYYNRKGFYSIVMQAVVDHKGIFRDVCIGWPGSVHDARVFVNSGLYRKAQRGTLFPPIPSKRIEGVDIPLLILADPAYPLLSWIQKPYSDNGHLTDAQRHFNFKLSQSRMAVEMAFERLKRRWRSLAHRCEHTIKAICRVVLTCAVLHNFCERAGETIPLEDNITETHQQDVDEVDPEAREEAQAIRLALTQHLAGVR
nr:uncharacterized protein LOC129442166 [Misgurnus anguillicaudatus]